MDFGSVFDLTSSRVALFFAVCGRVQKNLFSTTRVDAPTLELTMRDYFCSIEMIGSAKVHMKVLEKNAKPNTLAYIRQLLCALFLILVSGNPQKK